MNHSTDESQERFFETGRAELLRRLPWLNLFCCFRLAISPWRLAIGAAAAILLASGQAAIDMLPFAPDDNLTVQSSRWPWERPTIAPANMLDSPAELFAAPSGILRAACGQTSTMLNPIATIVEPGAQLFRMGNGFPEVAYAWTCLLYALAVWSLFGGAIARSAAVAIARDGCPHPQSCLDYSRGRFVSFMGAPLLPLIAILLLWIPCAAVGLLGRIPVAGETVVAWLWFVPLACGVALAFVLAVIAAGWPLMVCTVATEGSDAFDGLSRAYDYVLNRPWYAAWLVLLALVYGSASIFFVEHILKFGSHLADWAAATGMSTPSVVTLAERSPDGANGVATMFWRQSVSVLGWGFVYSFFWSAATMIYLLLRQSLDGTPLNDVAGLDQQPAADTPPLVGMAAAEAREQSAE